MEFVEMDRVDMDIVDMDIVDMDIVWHNIGALANIPLRGARRLCFGHAGKPVAVFRTGDDKVFALVDECPHRQGPLSEGIIAGHTVACPLHNWVIDLEGGEALEPDIGRTQTLPVRIVAGNVHVGLPRAAAGRAA